MSKLTTKKITFRQIQKAVLAADDAKGTGYDVKANQFSTSFSQMFKFLAKKEVDYHQSKNAKVTVNIYDSPSLAFLENMLRKYIKEEQKARKSQPKKAGR